MHREPHGVTIKSITQRLWWELHLQGTSAFLSEFWTGSTTDRRITQESGLVELLEEGDAVMADRGFNIHVRDILTKKKVYLNIPPFSKKGRFR